MRFTLRLLVKHTTTSMGFSCCIIVEFEYISKGKSMGLPYLKYQIESVLKTEKSKCSLLMYRRASSARTIIKIMNAYKIDFTLIVF